MGCINPVIGFGITTSGPRRYVQLLESFRLEALRELVLPSGEPLQFMLAVPGRRYSEFVTLLQPLQAPCEEAAGEISAEQPRQGLRLVVAHNPIIDRYKSLADIERGFKVLKPESGCETRSCRRRDRRCYR